MAVLTRADTAQIKPEFLSWTDHPQLILVAWLIGRRVWFLAGQKFGLCWADMAAVKRSVTSVFSYFRCGLCHHSGLFLTWAVLWIRMRMMLAQYKQAHMVDKPFSCVTIQKRSCIDLSVTTSTVRFLFITVNDEIIIPVYVWCWLTYWSHTLASFYWQKCVLCVCSDFLKSTIQQSHPLQSVIN